MEKWGCPSAWMWMSDPCPATLLKRQMPAKWAPTPAFGTASLSRNSRPDRRTKIALNPN